MRSIVLLKVVFLLFSSVLSSFTNKTVYMGEIPHAMLPTSVADAWPNRAASDRTEKPDLRLDCFCPVWFKTHPNQTAKGGFFPWINASIWDLINPSSLLRYVPQALKVAVIKFTTKNNLLWSRTTYRPFSTYLFSFILIKCCMIICAEILSC